MCFKYADDILICGGEGPEQSCCTQIELYMSVSVLSLYTVCMLTVFVRFACMKYTEIIRVIIIF